MKYARAVIASALGALALVEFLFWGGDGIGFTCLFIVLMAAYYIAVGFQKVNVRHTIEHLSIAVLIVALALCYSFFDNEALQVINFLALVFLMGLLFLHGTVGKSIEWDHPAFQAELLAGYIVRPFACFLKPWKEASSLYAGRKNAASDSVASSSRKRTFFQILAALLAAIPLLFIMISLLSNADPVFRSIFTPIVDWLKNLQLSEVMGKIILFLFLLPFVASSVWSYRDSFAICSVAGVPASFKTRCIPSASSITILALVNVLYLMFAGVQFAYLFGAWAGNLPAGVNPAEYARNGFFELAFISCINIAILLLSIRLTERKGNAGLIIRCLSIGLLVLSFVQLLSAMQRMNLYILAFGLTRLRYFVFAFMILMAVYFVFLLVKEFVPVFPIFRSMVFAGALALVVLNYTVPDARIAEYNISSYKAGTLSTLDTEYIANDLSAEGQLILLQNEDVLEKTNPELAGSFAELKEQLKTNQQYGPLCWKNNNLSKANLAGYYKS